MSFMMMNSFCPVCGRCHGHVAHESAEHLRVSSLIAANNNFKFEAEPAVRKRMTAREAMAITKVRYKETLDYLA